MTDDDSPALELPEEEPPLPEACLKSPDTPHSPTAGVARSGEPNIFQGFNAIFEEMTRLHARLLDAHHEELTHGGAAPSQGKTLSRFGTAGTVHFSDDAGEASQPVHPHVSLQSLEPQSKNMSTTLMMEARQKTVDLEQMLENNSMDSCSLQLREEWNLPEQKVLELKKITRRMSCGSLTGLVKPTIRRQYLVRVKSAGPWYILNPNSTKRTIWDLLALVAVLFEVCVTPLHFYRLHDSVRDSLDILHYALTAFWFLDIFATFFTAVYINDILRFRLKDIARHYLKSWFWFDLMMLVPDIIALLLPQLDDGTSGLLRISRARRMFRLLRFLQMFRFSKVLDKLQLLEKTWMFGVMQSDIVAIMRPLMSVTLVSLVSIHILGSLWFAFGDAQGGWVVAEGLHQAVLGRQYTRSLEWALSKLPPSSLKVVVDLNTPAERWLGILATCVALLSGSVFVSFVTNTMADVNRKRTRTKEILQAVRTYCGTHGVSFSHTMLIKRYVHREYARNELQQHMPLLQNLPEGMVRELFQEGRSQTLQSHDFFRAISESDPSMDLNLCSQAVSELHLLAGDTVFNTTSKVHGMYFLATGLGVYFYFPPFQDVKQRPARARQKEGPKSISSAASLLDLIVGPSMTNLQRIDMGMAQVMIDTGEYLAEPALWVKAWRYQGQFQAMVESRALRVSTDQFFQVCQDYANVMANTVVYARCFVNELNKSANLCKEVTDLPLSPPSKSKSLDRRGSERSSRPIDLSLSSRRRVVPEMSGQSATSGGF